MNLHRPRIRRISRVPGDQACSTCLPSSLAASQSRQGCRRWRSRRRRCVGRGCGCGGGVGAPGGLCARSMPRRHWCRERRDRRCARRAAQRGLRRSANDAPVAACGTGDGRALGQAGQARRRRAASCGKKSRSTGSKPRSTTGSPSDRPPRTRCFTSPA